MLLSVDDCADKIRPFETESYKPFSVVSVLKQSESALILLRIAPKSFKPFEKGTSEIINGTI